MTQSATQSNQKPNEAQPATAAEILERTLARMVEQDRRSAEADRRHARRWFGFMVST